MNQAKDTNPHKSDKRAKIKKIVVNFVGILLLAIGLFCLKACNFNALLSPAERVTDYQSSDFYQMVSNSRNERDLDSNVVIVPVDSLQRMEIVMLMSDIAICNPAAIGLDVMFAFPNEGDSLILEMLHDMPSLVLPMGVDNLGDTLGWVTKEAYLFDEMPKENRGVVNMDIDSPYGVVRTFRPSYDTNQGHVLNMATALALRTAPEAVERLKQVCEQQGGEAVHINYDAREYVTMNPSEVLQHPEMLEHKIVLIGMLNNPQDVHITPIDEYMPGLLIHAHALSTILNGDYLTTLPRWAQWVLGLLLCICFVVVRMLVGKYRAGSLFMWIFQIFMLLLIIVIGTLLFIHYHVIVELSFPLALIALGQLALDLWNGILGLFRIKNL